MHAGEHDIGAQAGTGDEGTEGADEYGCRRVGGAGDVGDGLRCGRHHAGRRGLHDVGQTEQAAHGDHDRSQGLDRLLDDCFDLLEVHIQSERAEQGAEQDDRVHPDDVAKEAHHGKALFREEGGNPVADQGDQDQHVNIGRQGLESGVFSLHLFLRPVSVFLWCGDGDQLDKNDGQDDGNDAGSQRGDLRSDEIGQGKHDQAAGDAGEGQIMHDALEPLGAEGDQDRHEGHDEQAQGVDPSDHGRVEGRGGDSLRHQRRAAADRGQARAAPGRTGAVTQQGDRDRDDRVKSQCRQEGRCQRRRRAGSRRAFQKDRDKDADDDQLDPPVIPGDLGDRGFHILDGPGSLERVQDRKGSEDHDDDLESFFESLPDIGIQYRDIVRQTQVCDIKISQGQEHSPQKRDGGHFRGRHPENHDADQYDHNGTDRKNKTKHNSKFPFMFQDGIFSKLPRIFIRSIRP